MNSKAAWVALAGFSFLSFGSRSRPVSLGGGDSTIRGGSFGWIGRSLASGAG